MRIDEVVNEGVIDNFRQGFQKGSAGMDRILSPDKWFKKSNTPQETPKQQTTPLVNSKDTKEVLSMVIADGVLRNPEMRVLNQLYSNIESGNANSRIDQKTVLPILQLVIKGKPLDDNQKAVLTQLKDLV
jgi:hypothetical protein